MDCLARALDHGWAENFDADVAYVCRLSASQDCYDRSNIGLMRRIKSGTVPGALFKQEQTVDRSHEKKNAGIAVSILN